MDDVTWNIRHESRTKQAEAILRVNGNDSEPGFSDEVLGLIAGASASISST